MNKKIIVLLGLLIIVASLLVVGCSSGEAVKVAKTTTLTKLQIMKSASNPGTITLAPGTFTTLPDGSVRLASGTVGNLLGELGKVGVPLDDPTGGRGINCAGCRCSPAGCECGC